MLDKTRPMKLGDIFSNTFNLIKETFTRSIVITVVFLMPAGILLAWGFEAFFKIIFITPGIGIENYAAEKASNLFMAYFAFLFPSGIFFLSLLASWIGITKIGCEAIDGRRISISDTFREIFSIIYLRCLGTLLLLISAFISFYILAVILFAVSSIGNVYMVKYFAGVTIVAGVIFIIYLFFKSIFAQVTVIYRYEGIFKSFSKSFFLIKGYWWRTFWIIFLISLIVGFASSIISTPITFIIEWDFISKVFKLVSDNASISSNPSAITGLMKSFGFTYGLIIAISTIINTLIYPLFYLVLYFDLKIRKNDFPEENKDEIEIAFEEPVI